MLLLVRVSNITSFLLNEVHAQSVLVLTLFFARKHAFCMCWLFIDLKNGYCNIVDVAHCSVLQRLPIDCHVMLEICEQGHRIHGVH